MFLEPDQITDGGPWYAETQVTDAFIIEPWNAFSSLAIAAPAFYFLWKIRKNPKQYGFLLAAIPFLMLNGIGSTLFHGFRTSRFFLIMDFIPALIVTLMVTVYFWSKVLPKWWMSFAVITPIFLMRFGIIDLIPGRGGINMSYTISGIAFLVPVFLHPKKVSMAQKRKHYYRCFMLYSCYLFPSGRQRFCRSHSIRNTFLVAYLYRHWCFPPCRLSPLY